jgi:hypothetical protein
MAGYFRAGESRATARQADGKGVRRAARAGLADDRGRARAERRDAAENRQQVLAAASRLFAARGVAAVSMDEIAREACVGKGTLYRRYAHKGGALPGAAR